MELHRETGLVSGLGPESKQTNQLDWISRVELRFNLQFYNRGETSHHIFSHDVRKLDILMTLQANTEALQHASSLNPQKDNRPLFVIARLSIMDSHSGV